MAAFNYTVRNLTGELVKGSIDAETQDMVVSKLREMDILWSVLMRSRRVNP